MIIRGGREGGGVVGCTWEGGWRLVRSRRRASGFGRACDAGV